MYIHNTNRRTPTRPEPHVAANATIRKASVNHYGFSRRELRRLVAEMID